MVAEAAEGDLVTAWAYLHRPAFRNVAAESPSSVWPVVERGGLVGGVPSSGGWRTILYGLATQWTRPSVRIWRDEPLRVTISYASGAVMCVLRSARVAFNPKTFHPGGARMSTQAGPRWVQTCVPCFSVRGGACWVHLVLGCRSDHRRSGRDVRRRRRGISGSCRIKHLRRRRCIASRVSQGNVWHVHVNGSARVSMYCRWGIHVQS